MMVPKRSIWARGFNVSLPCNFAVGSPSLLATHPWAASWRVIAKTTGIAITAIFCKIVWISVVCNLLPARSYHDQYLVRVHAVSLGHIDLLNHAGYRGVNLVLHLHGLHNEDCISSLHLVSNSNLYLNNRPGHRCGDVPFLRSPGSDGMSRRLYINHPGDTGPGFDKRINQ